MPTISRQFANLTSLAASLADRPSGMQRSLEYASFDPNTTADLSTCIATCATCGREVLARRFQKGTVALHCQDCADR
jgi:hypothetical protein